MKKILSLLIFLCAFKASASEIHLELEELVRESETIVIADLSEIKKWDEKINEYEEMQYASGILTVRKSIWGKYKSGDRIALHWRNRSTVMCPRNEHGDTKGQNYIWMLSFDDEGKLITGTNQRVRKLEEEAQIDSLLKRHPYLMKSMRGYHPEGSSIDVTMIFRNAHNHDVKIPAISFKNGQIISHPFYKINVAGQDITEKITASHDSRLVPARSEYPVVFPVRKIVNIDKPGYYGMEIFAELSGDARDALASKWSQKFISIYTPEAEKKAIYDKWYRDLKHEILATKGFYYINYQ